jgi:hypothetical protein
MGIRNENNELDTVVKEIEHRQTPESAACSERRLESSQALCGSFFGCITSNGSPIRQAGDKHREAVYRGPGRTDEPTSYQDRHSVDMRSWTKLRHKILLLSTVAIPSQRALTATAIAAGRQRCLTGGPPKFASSVKLSSLDTGAGCCVPNGYLP